MPENPVITLEALEESHYGIVGGKAANLARLLGLGHRVPRGFCISTSAYNRVVESGRIARKIEIELGRKPLEEMRWEELWDSALRIRSWFLKCRIPADVEESVREAYHEVFDNLPMVVRSSALGEDSSALSFAGLHESIVDVRGFESLLRAVRVVWASLWSDAALLYRREMALDPRSSAMAVVVQEFIPGGPSGVAFGRDPRSSDSDVAIIESVPGQNSDLVDGIIDPDRWLVDRTSGKIREWTQGRREEGQEIVPLLDENDVAGLLSLVRTIEDLFGWDADVEWTGRKENLKVLQARPISSLSSADDDEERQWYLSLRPGSKRLKKLAERVSRELIPQLAREGEKLAVEDLQSLTDRQLSSAIRSRLEILRKWQDIYVDDFIPLAHGVRQLGIYYNNAVSPEDPYEFMGLLQQHDMLASKRNNHLARMADMTRQDKALREYLGKYDAAIHLGQGEGWDSIADDMRRKGIGPGFLDELREFLDSEVDIAYKGERLTEHPEIFIHAILEMSGDGATEKLKAVDRETLTVDNLERKLLEAVGPGRAAEAEEALALGRLSWRLRDDDNLLVGRLESQLLRALEVAAERLEGQGLLSDRERLSDLSSVILSEALIDPPDDPIVLPEKDTDKTVRPGPPGLKARQLTGQPAGNGVASGRARIVKNSRDLLAFKAGEVLVCDAIQPTMTHIVPLACAIVERRGGMLIHGAIIARELGIPCVNGIADATRLIEDGESVTVDGYLGIVTIGPPEFSMETAFSEAAGE